MHFWRRKDTKFQVQIENNVLKKFLKIFHSVLFLCIFHWRMGYVAAGLRTLPAGAEFFRKFINLISRIIYKAIVFLNSAHFTCWIFLIEDFSLIECLQ